ncbi:hypothetical protein QYM36_013766 [Artemia franciscana]|uniref:N-acetyltransferase domain-containing protein n=1 Tax=Artemia franciscana TaxID=6661 RepID=A0AA88HDU6_ARTSF|nr:hypothetical protein QYM36_013766 [Artemia franciscana]
MFWYWNIFIIAVLFLFQISNVLPVTPSNSLEEIALESKLSYPLLLETVLEKQEDIVAINLVKEDEVISVKINACLGVSWSGIKKGSNPSENFNVNGFPTEEYVLELPSLDETTNVPRETIKIAGYDDEDILKIIFEAGEEVSNLLTVIHKMQNVEIFIAKHDEEAKGLGVFTFEKHAALVYFLYVKEKMRGKGIAKSIIYEAGKHAKKKGLSEIRAFSAPMGVPVFQSLGFKKIALWKAYFPNKKTDKLAGFLFGLNPIFDYRGYVELELELMKKYEGIAGFSLFHSGKIVAFKYPYIVKQAYGVRTTEEVSAVKSFMGDEEFKLFYEPGLVPESLKNEPSLLIREMRLKICDFDFSAHVSCKEVVLKIAKTSTDFDLVGDIFLSVYNIPKACSVGHCEATTHAVKLLATIEDQAVACAFLEPVSSLCKISYLQVSPDFRRRNIATVTMTFAVEVAKSLGCSELFLRSMPDAEPLYRKLGFSYVKDWYRIIVNPRK